MSRLAEVLELVSQSKNVDKKTRDLFDRIIELDTNLNYIDFNDYEDLLADDNEFIETIDDFLGIDVSDIFNDDGEDDVVSSTKRNKRSVKASSSSDELEDILYDLERDGLYGTVNKVKEGHKYVNRDSDSIADDIDIKYSDDPDIILTNNGLPGALNHIPGQFLWVGFRHGKGKSLNKKYRNLKSAAYNIAEYLDGEVADFTKDTDMFFVFVPEGDDEGWNNN